MDIDLVRENSSGWVGVVPRYSMDMSFGGDDNDFNLTVPERYSKFVDGSSIETGDLVFFPGTEYGGVVDSVGYDNTGDNTVLSYSGRTWHGIMSHSVIMPEGDHLTVSGPVEQVLSDLVDRQGLGDVFQVVPGDEGTVKSYSFDRFADMYSGIRGMLRSAGMRLRVSKGRGRCELSAVARRDLSSGMDDNLLRMSMESNSRPVNHLVCAGEGEGGDRVVVHLYADGDGAVSRTRTFSGIDEVAELYSFTSADEEQIVESGTERLLGYYEDSRTLDANIPDSAGAGIGDVVRGSSVSVPVSVEAEVSRISVKSDNVGGLSVSYKVGSLKVFM